MLSRTISYGVNGSMVKATVRTDTGRMFLDRQVLYGKLNYDAKDDIQLNRAIHFAHFVSQSADVEGLPFAWPSPASSAAELNAAFEALLDLPSDLIALWLDAVNEVNRPPVDPDLGPDVSEAKKKTRK